MHHDLAFGDVERKAVQDVAKAEERVRIALDLRRRAFGDQVAEVGADNER